MIYLPILYTHFARECAALCFMARMNINERVRIPHRVLLVRNRNVRACMQIYIELSVLQLAEIQCRESPLSCSPLSLCLSLFLLRRITTSYGSTANIRSI